MLFRRIVISLFGLGGVGGLVAGIVSCGKTANAVLPVEYVVQSENVSFRSDRSDARAAPGLSSWNTTKPLADFSKAAATLRTKIAPGIVTALKSVIGGFVSNYAGVQQVDGGENGPWKALFADINAQRNGSGTIMVEMSRVYFRDTGSFVFADGKTSVAPGETGTVEFVIEKLHFDGYATNDNSPAASFQGLLSPPQGHHWEVDLAADPIVLTVTFTNSKKAVNETPEEIAKASISKVEDVNFDVLTSYALSARSQRLTQAEYRAILADVPAAGNYYKNRITAAGFTKIFGPNARPAKVTASTGT